jgi:hypothetical protein
VDSHSPVWACIARSSRTEQVVPSDDLALRSSG